PARIVGPRLGCSPQPRLGLVPARRLGAVGSGDLRQWAPAASPTPPVQLQGSLPVSDATQKIEIPADLKPNDGRFGAGPSKIRPESVAALAATGASYLGTSHRRPGVKKVVGQIRAGLTDLFELPDGYEIVLGNGGATA